MFPENQMWFVQVCISCSSKIVTKSAKVSKRVHLHNFPTVSPKVSRKVEDRASHAYFIDKAFAFYVSKLLPLFPYLSVHKLESNLY